jgi:hypothetical protein
MTGTESIILIAYDWNGVHDEGQVTDPGTRGLVVTADGFVIAHPPYDARLIRVGIVTPEAEQVHYGPEAVC